jgi:hypothetical protein
MHCYPRYMYLGLANKCFTYLACGNAAFVCSCLFRKSFYYLYIFLLVDLLTKGGLTDAFMMKTFPLLLKNTLNTPVTLCFDHRIDAKFPVFSEGNLVPCVVYTTGYFSVQQMLRGQTASLAAADPLL